MARQAVARLNLTPPRIGIVPKATPGSIGAVGLPVWMWTLDRTWAPRTATATVGSVSTTATGRITQVRWDMGDGHTVTCTTPGTVYQKSMGMATSPDCGYKYLRSSYGQPGDAYTVRATATWQVTWEGYDNGGQVIELTDEAQIQVGEYQVVNR